MVNKNFLKNKTTHFFSTLVLLTFLVYFQSSFLAKISFRWMHIDFVTISIVYVCVEHFLPFAFIKIIFVALLLQTLSSVAPGFYVMYFLLILLFSRIISKFLLFSTVFGNFLIFIILFFLKYFLLYFTIQQRDFYYFLSIILISWKGFLSTSVVSLFVFKMLSSFDSFFENRFFQEKKA